MLTWYQAKNCVICKQLYTCLISSKLMMWLQYTNQISSKEIGYPHKQHSNQKVCCLLTTKGSHSESGHKTSAWARWNIAGRVDYRLLLQWAPTLNGQLKFRKHESHDLHCLLVVKLEDCPLFCWNSTHLLKDWTRHLEGEYLQQTTDVLSLAISPCKDPKTLTGEASEEDK